MALQYDRRMGVKMDQTDLTDVGVFVDAVMIPPREVKRMLGVDGAMLARWRRAGVGPEALDIGERTRWYRRADVEKYVGELPTVHGVRLGRLSGVKGWKRKETVVRYMGLPRLVMEVWMVRYGVLPEQREEIRAEWARVNAGREDDTLQDREARLKREAEALPPATVSIAEVLGAKRDAAPAPVARSLADIPVKRAEIGLAHPREAAVRAALEELPAAARPEGWEPPGLDLSPEERTPEQQLEIAEWVMKRSEARQAAAEERAAGIYPGRPVPVAPEAVPVSKGKAKPTALRTPPPEPANPTNAEKLALRQYYSEGPWSEETLERLRSLGDPQARLKRVSSGWFVDDDLAIEMLREYGLWEDEE